MKIMIVKVERCPRCHCRKIIDYEDTFECSECMLEFEKKDFKNVDEIDLLSIQEKMRVIRILRSKTNLFFPD